MKTFFFFIIGLSVLLGCTLGVAGNSKDNQAEMAATSTAPAINITSSQELSPLATVWATEFGLGHPSVKFNLSTEGLSAVNSAVHFTSVEPGQGSQGDQQWKMVVAHDAIVLVVNAKNPQMEQIALQGVAAEEMAQLFANPDKRTWSRLLSGGSKDAVNYYLLDNERVNMALARFTSIDNAMSTGNRVASDEELITAVRQDAYAIGICRLSDVRDASTNEIAAGLKLLPIDKNRNGQIDRFEDIYTSMNAFTRGIWIGKYPHALCGNIYATAAAMPADQQTLAFLNWITTDGQKYLNPNGFSNLNSRDIHANLAMLSGTEVVAASKPAKPFRAGALLIIVVLVGISAWATVSILRMVKKQRLAELNEEVELTNALNGDAIEAPKGLYFDKTHTWAFMEENGMVKVGVDDFLQHITGTITRVGMKKMGESVRKGEKIMTIVREGKQLEIYAPISGVIKDYNHQLSKDSSLINLAPFTRGWVYQMEPKNWLRETQFMFMAEKYKEWLKDEFTRLKDFFAASARNNTAVYAQVILQDGGELSDNILAEMGPEVWEDFQTKFIDTSR